MNNYDRALELSRQNNHEEAVQCLRDVIKNKETAPDETLSAYQLLIDQLNKLKKEEAAGQIKQEFSKFLFVQKKYTLAATIFDELVKESRINEGEILKYGWKLKSMLGEVEAAHHYAKEFLAYLIRRKNTLMGLNFVNEAIGFGANLEVYERYKMAFLILQNDIKALVPQTKKIIGKYRKYHYQYEELRQLDQLIFKELDQWKSEEMLYQFRIFFRIEELRKIRSTDVTLQKEIVNILYEYLIFYPDSVFPYVALARYGILVKRKKILQMLSVYYKGNEEKFKREKWAHNEIMSALKKEKDILDFSDDIENVEEIDLGEDLFSAEKEDKIKRLVRDINFLSQNNDKEKVVRLMRELEKIDPGNILLKKQETVKAIDRESTRSKIVVPLEELEAKLLDDLGRHARHETKEDERFRAQNQIAKAIELLPVEDWNLYSYDLLVALLMMDMWKSAHDAIEKMKMEEMNTDDALRWLYLGILSLIGLQRQHEALGKVEEVLKTWPIAKEERICFLYLAGEICRNMKKYKEAKKAYQAVRDLDANYRLVKQRLEFVEEKIKV